MISTQMARWRAKAQYQQKQRERRERIAAQVYAAMLPRAVHNGQVYAESAARDALALADIFIAELDK